MSRVTSKLQVTVPRAIAQRYGIRPGDEIRFPRSILAPSDADSAIWRENFIRTCLERDVPAFGPRGGDPAALLDHAGARAGRALERRRARRREAGPGDSGPRWTRPLPQGRRSGGDRGEGDGRGALAPSVNGATARQSVPGRRAPEGRHGCAEGLSATSGRMHADADVPGGEGPLKPLQESRSGFDAAPMGGREKATPGSRH